MFLPYIDPATFIEAPTGLDTSQLVPGGQAAAESAALQNILARASSWVDWWCYAPGRLAASTNSEQQAVTADRTGRVQIWPKGWPIISLTTVQWASPDVGSPMTWTTVPATGLVPLERSFLVIDQDYSYWRLPGAPKLLFQYVYLNGWAHTTLSSAATKGASTISVASTTGITTNVAGVNAWNTEYQLTILDGANREDVTVSGVSGTTLTLATPLVNAHSSGALVTAIPPTIQDATIKVAAAMVKVRGSGAIVMASQGVARVTKSEAPGAFSDMDDAKEMLEPFRMRRAA